MIAPAADLGVVKAARPMPITAGGTETYRIRVTNHDRSTAAAIAFTDHLPAGVTALRLPAGCTARGESIVRCKISSLRVAASATRNIQVHVASSKAGGKRLANRIQVLGALADHVNADAQDQSVAATGPRLILHRPPTGAWHSRARQSGTR